MIISLSYHRVVCKHDRYKHKTYRIYIQKYNTTGPCHRPSHKIDVIVIITIPFFTTFRCVLMDCFNLVNDVGVKFPIRRSTTVETV